MIAQGTLPRRCASDCPTTAARRAAPPSSGTSTHEFDEPISDFRADGLLDFFLRELGPPVYNQGVRDACGYVQDKLADIEGEIHEPEPPR